MTRQVNAGGLLIGGGAPVSIQSMTNTKTGDASATLAQIMAWQAGCQLVRVAANDKAAAAAARPGGAKLCPCAPTSTST